MIVKPATSYLDIITAAFAVVLILSNIASVKIITIGPLSFDGGLLLFACTYILGDILTEVYGYARARRLIWIGFAANILMVCVLGVVGLLPADPTWIHQESYTSILGMVPRIVVASFIAYLVGAFTNSYILAKMKIRAHGKHFWKRAISSTVVGQLFDTTIFVCVAFWGVLPGSLLFTVWATNYVFKVLVEVVFLPATYYIVRQLKVREAIDYFDNHTKFSPFVFEEKE